MVHLFPLSNFTTYLTTYFATAFVPCKICAFCIDFVTAKNSGITGDILHLAAGCTPPICLFGSNRSFRNVPLGASSVGGSHRPQLFNASKQGSEYLNLNGTSSDNKGSVLAKTEWGFLQA